MNETNKVRKYKYLSFVRNAVGEILLIVIGILIAFEIDNWQLANAEKKLQINILKGIKSDIESDLYDVNYNIRKYLKYQDSDRIVMEHIVNKKPKDKHIVSQIERFTREDYTIILHHSHFEETKSKGLSIITNETLRDSISKLYEFDYPYLTYSENEDIFYDHLKILNPELIRYIELDSNGIHISDASYQELTQNKHIHFIINKAIKMKSMLFNDHYLPKLGTMMNTLKLIDKELSYLEQD
ncbi:MAG: DUF6090 family protein [Bacteroidia bacterium]